MNISIIYEDSDVVAITKPQGIMVHPDGVSKDKTISDWMLETYPESKDVGEPMTIKNGEEITRPGIVHRLDRDTSGVLILAKTENAHAFLKEAFKNREVQKEYTAIVYGVMKTKEGVVDKPIGRSSQNFRVWSAGRGARGKLRDAVTEYRVFKDNGKFSIVKLFPKTGRTHQLRAHMKYINYPIVCDKLYAPKRECALGFERMALHARSITLTLPSGAEKTIKADFPEDFKKAIDSFEDLP